MHRPIVAPIQAADMVYISFFGDSKTGQVEQGRRGCLLPVGYISSESHRVSPPNENT